MKARIPVNLMLLALYCRAKENGHRIFSTKPQCHQEHGGNGNQSKSWSMSEPSISGKGTKRENTGAKGSCKGTKVGTGTG